MRSAMVKRSVVIAGHKTSVSLEEPFWAVMRQIAESEATTVSAILRRIEASRGNSNLSSATRVFALEHVRGRAGVQTAAVMPARAAAMMSPTGGNAP